MPIWISRTLIAVTILLAMVVAAMKLIHGGGEPYQDLSTAPLIDAQDVTRPIRTPYPPGMVASSPSGRLFYTYHMLHKPERFVDATVFEWRNGEGVPFPNLDTQVHFEGAMGVHADNVGRLWVIKPGALEGRQTRLLALDIASGELLIDHAFKSGEAGFAQDLRVSADGRYVFLADTGLFRFTAPSLLVFDVAQRRTRTLLAGHTSVSAQDWVMRKTNGDPYKLAFGLLTFVVGVDGIALSHDDHWLYYATMSHDSVYRVPVSILLDESLNDEAIATHIEFVGYKPMSDGIELLADNTVIITDVENGGIGALRTDGTYVTLTKDSNVDWADSVTIDPEGAIWFTDSRLTHLIDQFAQPSSDADMQAHGPYSIYRIADPTQLLPASL